MSQATCSSCWLQLQQHAPATHAAESSARSVCSSSTGHCWLWFEGSLPLLLLLLLLPRQTLLQHKQHRQLQQQQNGLQMLLQHLQRQQQQQQQRQGIQSSQRVTYLLPLLLQQQSIRSR
jgi:hypothetical protein